MHNRKQSGKRAEQAACQFLIGQGLCLLETNFRCKLGEIDLIMQDKDDIVFIEVRSRSRKDYGNAAESVNMLKQRKVTNTATLYLQKKKLLYKVHSRIDVIAIHYLAGKMEIEWIRNAF